VEAIAVEAIAVEAIAVEANEDCLRSQHAGQQQSELSKFPQSFITFQRSW
jgi:hypothetical protein